LTGHRLDIRVNPDFVRADEIPSLCGDPARLHRGWGWQPHYSLRRTLDDMLKASPGATGA
jgi:GDP-D-mannose dehydratase